MPRTLLLLGVGALLIMTLSVPAYGDAVYAQAKGENLLHNAMVHEDRSSERARFSALPTDSVQAAMTAGANKALGRASNGRANAFIVNSDGGSGSGSGSGTGSASKNPADAVPEPLSLILFGTGLVGVAVTLRRYRS